MLRFHQFILADSHGDVIGNALEQHGIYNLSNNSDNYADAFRKITYLVRRGVRVDKIYLTVDEHTLSTYREDAPNCFMSVYHYADYNSYKRSTENANVFTFAYAKSMRPFLPLLQTDNAYFINNFFVTKFKAAPFESTSQSWNDVVDKSNLTKARIENQFRDGRQSAALKTMLLQIVELCRANNIELIGLKFPLTDIYLDQLGSLSCHADSVFLKNGLKIVDMQNAFAHQPVLFKDQDHLNEAGVQAFAAQFIELNKR